MNYLGYVAAAYAVFIALVLWDWLSPWWQVRRALRAATLRARRESARAGTAATGARSNDATQPRDPTIDT